MSSSVEFGYVSAVALSLVMVCLFLSSSVQAVMLCCVLLSSVQFCYGG